MKITVLCENTSCREEIACEHGLSLYLQTENNKILFDMGQTEMFAENAKKLNCEPADVDIAVLSHGHYDHGGGLQRFLDLNNKAPIYLSKYAFEGHYNAADKYIGLDTALMSNSRLVFTDKEISIDDNMTLYPSSDCENRYDTGNSGLQTLENGRLVKDDFRHEQYLLIEENGKRILFSGCSHKGILNIADHFRPDVLIGGFHFSKLPLDETLDSYAKMLDRYSTTYYTCHCTGTEQYNYMKQTMKNLHRISAGQTIII